MPLFFLIIGLAISILTYSGFGKNIHLNEIFLSVSYIFALYYYFFDLKDSTFKLGKIAWPISGACLIMLINVFLNWKDINQLLNYTTLFGMVVGVSILSRIKWSEINYYKTGITLFGLAWLLTQLFMPGRVLSGWNDNSVIGIVPSLMCGLCFIYISRVRSKSYIFYGCLILTVSIVMTLENRSSLLSLLIFSIISYPKLFKLLKNKLYFRIFYISTLVINVGFPLFNEVIGQWDIYNDLMSASQDYVHKDGGFSGRDLLWDIALFQFGKSPFLGLAGLRGIIYYHNFSCDVLTLFGWLGWITFAAMYCAIMEKCFSKDGKTNIFLIAFSSLLILNTFENALLANGYFTIFPYFLLAIAWQLKYYKSEVRTQ